MKMIRIVLVMALFGLQYKLWFGDGGVLQAHRLNEKCIALEHHNKKLNRRNHAIESDIIGLKSGGQALEEQARTELGMVKQNEEYYQFVD
jgi:cell division protein FtsB